MIKPRQPMINCSVLVSSSQRGGRGSFRGCGDGGRGGVSYDDRDKLKCEHYGRSKHAKENCWDLHDCPQPDLQSRPQPCSFSGGRGDSHP